MLTYFSELGFPSNTILLYLNIPTVILTLFLIPFGYLGDRFGTNKTGLVGIVFSLMGLLSVSLCGLFEGSSMHIALLAGLVATGLGQALYTSGWLSLLDPLINNDERGRFFGRLTLSWQTYGIIMGLIVAWLLGDNPDKIIYRNILLCISALYFFRIFFYLQMPVLNKSKSGSAGLIKGLKQVISYPEFLAFGCYLFLLGLATGTVPFLMGLLQKNVLGFSVEQIVNIGVSASVGAMCGFFIGGKLVDRFGCKFIFLVAHMSYGVLLFSVLARDFFGLQFMTFFMATALLWGLVNSTSAIAITSEMVAVTPSENKSIGLSFLITMTKAGIALSAFLCSQLLSLDFLSSNWVLFGCSMSQYDGLILLLGIAVVLITVTLGLIPSVVPKLEYLPRQDNC